MGAKGFTLPGAWLESVLWGHILLSEDSKAFHSVCEEGVYPCSHLACHS